MAYDKDTDYQAKIDESVKKGDYASAAKYEALRNEKIDAEGLPYEKTYNYKTLQGVDGNTINTINSKFTQSEDVTKAENEKNEAFANVKDVTSNKDIISSSVKDTLNKEFVTPSAVTKADAYLADSLQKIQSGKTSYSDSVKDMMDKITNREKFSYDVDTDPLFQQALASAMNSGKTAMQDTIGQASALTGGYGSTYATTAGNQAYNSFIEDAYDNLPQYYQMALEAYQAEGDEMYRQLSMYNDADDKEYNRMVTAYDATYQDRNSKYNEAYSQFRDSKSDAFNMANIQLNEHNTRVNDAYTFYNAASNNADTLYNREYQQWSDSVNQAYKYAEMLNSDYWNKTNFDEGVRQYEKSYAEDVRQYNETLAENKRQYDTSLAEDKRQFDAQMSYNWSSLNRSGSSGGSGGGGGNGFSLTTSQLNAAIEANKKAGGGERGAQAAIDTLVAMGVPVDDNTFPIIMNAIEAGGGTTSSMTTGTISQFRTTKGDNFNIKVNGTYYGVENHGRVEDSDTLKNLNSYAVSNNTAFLYNGDAYVKYAGGYYKVGNMWGGKKAYHSLLDALQK